MIRALVDASDVTREETEAEKVLRPGGELVRAIEHRLKEAAMTERFTHEYKNQTGHLQQSTEAAVVSETDNEIEIHLEMGEEYASYVVDRGYSEFEEIAAEAFRDIDGIIFDMSDRLR
jgi:hypothetical protein